MSDLSQILADCDANRLLHQLENFDIQIRSHLPAEVYRHADGELNPRNKYGAILFHCSILTATLRNFGVGDRS